VIIVCEKCTCTTDTRVKEVAVDGGGGFARVTFDGTKMDVPAMHDAVLKSGYKPIAGP